MTPDRCSACAKGRNRAARKSIRTRHQHQACNQQFPPVILQFFSLEAHSSVGSAPVERLRTSSAAVAYSGVITNYLEQKRFLRFVRPRKSKTAGSFNATTDKLFFEHATSARDCQLHVTSAICIGASMFMQAFQSFGCARCLHLVRHTQTVYEGGYSDVDVQGNAPSSA